MKAYLIRDYVRETIYRLDPPLEYSDTAASFVTFLPDDDWDKGEAMLNMFHADANGIVTDFTPIWHGRLMPTEAVLGGLGYEVEDEGLIR